MTITVNNNRIDYAGNGATTVFAYDFKILVDSEIKVYLDGVLKTISTHYTVSGVGVAAGGNVTFLTAPGSGVVVTLISEVPLSQATDYLIGSKFPAETHEAALDKLTRISQQFDRRLRDTLMLQTQSLFEDLTLPDPVSGRLLRWKADLSGLENVTLVDLGSGSFVVITTLGDLIQGGTGGLPERLPIGAAGEVLTVVAGKANWEPAAGGDHGALTGLADDDHPQYALDSEAILKTIVDAKGDLIVATAADTVARKAVGADGSVLTALAADGTGVTWSIPKSRSNMGWRDAGAINAVGTWYLGPHAAATTELIWTLNIMPRAGTARLLYAAVAVAPGGAETAIFTVRKNGVDQAITCTITGAALTASDLTNSFAFAAGDNISIKVVLSATAASRLMTTGLELEVDAN